MKFSELEQLMISRGINSLADIARALSTTPQAVSNWKSRDQVPYHIVSKIKDQESKIQNPTLSVNNPQGTQFTTHYSPFTMEEDTISISNILLTMAEQLKIIALTTFISVFFTFTYVQFIQQPIYESHSTILLPKSNAGLGGLAGGGLAGLASSFGVNVPTGSLADLSSPSLFPELINSRVFAERIIGKSFYAKKFNKELSLLAILTYGDGSPKFGLDTLVQQSMGALQNMISFENQGSFSVLTVKAEDPTFARDLNKVVLDELKSLNNHFKSQHLSEKTNFIIKRIESVEGDLKKSEQTLKIFREQNRQIASPSLQLELEHLTRDVEIQKGIYLTLKQQQELAKIEVVEKTSIVQVLDEPHVPLGPSNKMNLKLSILLASILGVGIGIVLGFIRSYANNSEIAERKKLRRAKYFFKKKTKEFILDQRVFGIVLVVMLIGLPFFIGHKSNVPVFFGLYSAKLMLVNTIYVLTLIFSLGLFIYNYKKK